MKICKIMIALMISAVASFGIKSNVQAADDWEFSLAPFYLWAINISGDQIIGPVSAPVDVEFSDVFDNLDSAFIVHFEAAHKSNWGFLVDVNYLDLENKQSPPAGITRKIDLDLSLIEVSGFHRWVMDNHNFDLILGGRYVRVSNKISIGGGSNLVDGAQDWIDPLAGLRWTWGFADDWSFVARGDVGGLQVGSDFAWQGLGVVEWQPFNYVSFLAGYRAIGMDYEDGSSQSRDHFHFDATVHGPVIGINFRW